MTGSQSTALAGAGPCDGIFFDLARDDGIFFDLARDYWRVIKGFP